LDATQAHKVALAGNRGSSRSSRSVSPSLVGHRGWLAGHPPSRRRRAPSSIEDTHRLPIRI